MTKSPTIARRERVARDERVLHVLKALAKMQPATIDALFEQLAHPRLFPARRSVYNTLHHFAGDRSDSSAPVVFERSTSRLWKLTQQGERMWAARATTIGSEGQTGDRQRTGEADESTVYARGQTVVPKRIRDAMGVEEGATLMWSVEDGIAKVFAIPKDPVAALYGIMKDKGPTFEEYLAERNAERKRERELEMDQERRWRTYSTRRR